MAKISLRCYYIRLQIGKSLHFFQTFSHKLTTTAAYSLRHMQLKNFHIQIHFPLISEPRKEL